MNKKVFGKSWWIFGLLSALCAFLVPYVGWFAIGNLAVILVAAYVLHLGKERMKRIEKANKVMKKSSKKVRDQLARMDQMELKQIYSMSKVLVPTIIAGNFLLNLYTCFYYVKKQIMLLDPHLPIPMAAPLVLDGIMAGLLFWSFSIRIQDIITGEN